MAIKSLKQIEREIEANDPPIEVNQYWNHKRGKEILHRVRILALHPDPGSLGQRRWIVERCEAKMTNFGVSELTWIPEYNLRLIFRLEKTV